MCQLHVHGNPGMINRSYTCTNTDVKPVYNVKFNYNDKTVHEINIDPYLGLDEIRKKNIGRVVIGHINISSPRNKFEPPKSFIEKRIDFLVVTETKIDQSFSSNEFSIGGFPLHLGWIVMAEGLGAGYSHLYQN